VKQGRIVGRGWHCGPGTKHAEIVALDEAGSRARGATVYVTLEPCCHHGRTPPCTDALIQAKIARVIYAVRDPNPLVAGRGARLLQQQGIEVVRGVCAAEARALNEVYFKFRATGRPFVSIKVAASLDGKTATRSGRSKWITDDAARTRGRRIRAEHQAILTGVTTILQDDPHLGPRLRGAPEPWRIVLDSRLRTPPGSQVVRSKRCIVACTEAASESRQRRLERLGVRIWRFRGKRVPLRKLLSKLGANGIISVLVEGGSEVLGSVIDAGLADRAYWFVSPKIIGSQAARSAIGGAGASWPSTAVRLRAPRIERAGDGWLIVGELGNA
jgi:diaminohydroxyphosphoribosylaminopyrimidine deaminase/5-amino-6-(5-phosphoribosylamino)uracil reductase